MAPPDEMAWQREATERQKFLGHPTTSFARLFSSTNPGPQVVIEYAQSSLGCLVVCDSHGTGNFTLNPNAQVNPTPVAPLAAVGPFILTPGSSLQLGWIDGSPTVTAITWLDPLGQMVERLEKILATLRNGA